MSPMLAENITSSARFYALAADCKFYLVSWICLLLIYDIKWRICSIVDAAGRM